MFTRAQVKEVIAMVSNPALAQGPDNMVYQVWEDGEITLQKNGELLWQRSLHCMEAGLGDKKVPLEWMTGSNGEHAYIFCTHDDALIVRDMIRDMEHE